MRREFRHWLVGNIPGDKVDQGETLTEYVGSGPPKDSGKIQVCHVQKVAHVSHVTVLVDDGNSFQFLTTAAIQVLL